MSDHRCTGCREVKPRSAFHNDSTKVGGRATRCKACVSLRQKVARAFETDEQREHRRTYLREYARTQAPARRARYALLRERALEAYGAVCDCCGETESAFLTFDHVGEWGAQHRQADSSATSIVLWLHRHGYPQDGTIRLLCWNCNCARGIYGCCPHEQRIEVAS